MRGARRSPLPRPQVGPIELGPADATPARRPASARPTHDRGFTLVEIVVAIVIVGILSAVVVVGVGRLTSQGSTAACQTSLDAARAAATAHWATTGTQPTTFTDMVNSGSLTVPNGVDVNATSLTASEWTLTLSPFGVGPPSFACFVGARPPGRLDAVATRPAAAFGLERLLASYTGPLVRVARSSDGASADIGATGSGALDTTALTAFVGSADARVVTWYDQTGGGRHATPATSSRQPRLVIGGAVVLSNGRPVLAFDGAAGGNLLTVANYTPPLATTWLAVANRGTQTTDTGSCCRPVMSTFDDGPATASGLALSAYRTGSGSDDRLLATFWHAPGTRSRVLWPTGTSAVISLTTDGTTIQVGHGTTFDSRAASDVRSSSPLYIGGELTHARRFAGTIAVAVAYDSALSNNDISTLATALAGAG